MARRRRFILDKHLDASAPKVTAGEDRNARLRVKLVNGRRHALRDRLKCSDTTNLQ